MLRPTEKGHHSGLEQDPNDLSFSGEVAHWLAPWICSANREVGSSNLTASTDDPLG